MRKRDQYQCKQHGISGLLDFQLSHLTNNYNLLHGLLNTIHLKGERPCKRQSGVKLVPPRPKTRQSEQKYKLLAEKVLSVLIILKSTLQTLH